MKINIRALFIFVLICISLLSSSLGQGRLDSIEFWRNEWNSAKDDTTRLNFISKLASGYRFSNVDSSLYFNNLALEFSQKLNLPAIEVNLLSLKGATLLENGRLPESLQLQFEALKKSMEIRDTNIIAFSLNRIGNTYMELGNYQKANDFYFQSWYWFESIHDTLMMCNEMTNIGNVHELSGEADSALYYQLKVFEAVKGSTDRVKVTRPELMFRMGNAYKLRGDSTRAISYYKKGIEEALTDHDLRNLTMNHLFLARLYKELSQNDSSRKYAIQALRIARTMPFAKGIYESATILSELFAHASQFDSAYAYMLIANREKENLTGTARLLELQNIVLDEQENQRTIEAKRIADQNRQRQLILISGLGIILLIALLLYRNNHQKQKANSALKEQKQKVESTLDQLKSAQAQLIQSEKMASLGELTAGIAHEIQNPLNFVNNFSEVNSELIDEASSANDSARQDEVRELLRNLKENQQKIKFHGDRADAIVKSMLQHTQSRTGQKEPTDINELCSEYLRLAYHGFRAKDETLHMELTKNLDPTIGKISMIPQDIGRVMLNLYNNSFHAVARKARLNGANFKPLITVATQKSNGQIEIKVKDNGMGIPDSIREKIFQPFFTTKPTGEGTGLGLSLSYDIVKAHGGEIKVSSREGEGTEFMISLPIV